MPGPGRPFQKGPDARRLEGGSMTKRRMALVKLSEALDKEFTREDGTDELAKLIADAARTGDSADRRLAAEYRVGKPPQAIEHSGPDGEDLELKIVLVKPGGNSSG